MLSTAQVQSSLLFLALSYIFITFIFSSHSDSSSSSHALQESEDGGKRAAKKRRNLITSTLVIALAVAVKVVYDSSALGPNLYAALEVPRHSNTLEIRRAYKDMSKKYHPDKNPEAADRFRLIKTSYDILMDETQREVYNRFGEAHLDFDPRKDEMKLVSDLAVVCLFWLLLAYIMTSPMAAHASRTWIAIMGIAMLAVEVALCLTETPLPAWASFNKFTTEHEFVYALHSVFPAVVACLRCVAEFLFVDADASAILVLRDVCMQQKALKELLHEAQTTLATAQVANASSGEVSLSKSSSSNNDSIRTKLVDLCDQIDATSESTLTRIEALRSCSANPGANYYWILFLLMYGGVYFIQ